MKYRREMQLAQFPASNRNLIRTGFLLINFSVKRVENAAERRIIAAGCKSIWEEK